ncbi:MAG TPA: trimethylamine methyltransferase family protein [Anaerolineales bacterium]|nr:trimethylamine methyltransferase family protein [Anaerolineales bacterium]
MPLRTTSPSAPLLRVLTPEGVDQIHQTVLKTLGEIGVVFPHPEAQALFRRAGARVQGDRVCIPEGLLEDTLAEVPPSVTLYTREGEPAMVLEGHESHFGTYGTALYWYEPETGERRRGTRQAVGFTARVCDYLPNVEWSMPMAVPSDVPTPVADLYQFYDAVTNHRKPLYSSTYTAGSMAEVVEMAAVIAGGKEALRQRPFFTTGINSGSPFVYSQEVVGRLLVMAEAGLPIIFNPMPMAGGTAPATLAGTVVVALVEGLAGLTLAQLKNPGVPVITGGVLATMDMRTTVCGYGAPELALMMAAITEMCRHYRVPSYGTAGCSNSKLPDAQAAMEATNSILMSALAGSNLVHDIGLVDTGMTVSLEAFVLSDEIIGMVRHITRGIVVDEEELAFEVMKAVGPGGHFLADPHTLRHFRRHHQSPLIDRRRHEAWFLSGAETMEDRIKEKVRWILENHHPTPLPEAVLQELERILQRARARLAA